MWAPGWVRMSQRMEEGNPRRCSASHSHLRSCPLGEKVILASIYYSTFVAVSYLYAPFHFLHESLDQLCFIVMYMHSWMRCLTDRVLVLRNYVFSQCPNLNWILQQLLHKFYYYWCVALTNPFSKHMQEGQCALHVGTQNMHNCYIRVINICFWLSLLLLLFCVSTATIHDIYACSYFAIKKLFFFKLSRYSIFSIFYPSTYWCSIIIFKSNKLIDHQANTYYWIYLLTTS